MKDNEMKESESQYFKYGLSLDQTVKLKVFSHDWKKFNKMFREDTHEVIAYFIAHVISGSIKVYKPMSPIHFELIKEKATSIPGPKLQVPKDQKVASKKEVI
jgi:hypothetical protein